MKTNPRHIQVLDGFRGVAILAVFLFHALGVSFGIYKLPWDGMARDFDVPKLFLALFPSAYGWAGVAIFFVVSGFCIHLSHMRSSQSDWGSFFARRFFRIYPPYLLAIVLFFFCWPWGFFSIDSASRLRQLIAHLFSIHNLNKQTFAGINPSFWTIAVEVQLYLIYPLLLLLTHRVGWKTAMIITAAIEVGIRTSNAVYGTITAENLPHWFIYSPFGFWLSWSLGAYLADAYLENKDIPFRRWPVMPFLLAAFAVAFFRPTAYFSFPLFAVFTAVIISRFLSGTWSIPRRGIAADIWNHLSALGLVSYSFYLLHQPCLSLVRRSFHKFFPDFDVHPLIALATCLALYLPILGLACCCYRWLEKPSVKLGKKLINKRRQSIIRIQPTLDSSFTSPMERAGNTHNMS
jgi:peptidoglycan/LPS O-acetylase OafA/YrhL